MNRFIRVAIHVGTRVGVNVIKVVNNVNNNIKRIVYTMCICAAPALWFGAPAHAGDIDAGRAVAQTCIACHGADGNSPTALFPNLAGQVPGYIAAQLALFKSGARENAVMAPFIAQLTETNFADLDAYYASLPARKGAITPEQQADADAGGAIYRGGYAPYNIAACMSCHGPSGHGIPPAYPRIAGQHATYLEAQLLAFKSGARKNAVMNPIAFALSEQQIKQLALYMSALY